ncbi:cell division protein FtsQ/DivIB [Candidatus Pelagibacter sp.]|uniref:cell division protein FtsQ/DivIB n=1 Tax=Candidatus Pelagibacter sp. TaxID=2024849 RepID=UPI003F84ACE0
MHQLIGKKFLFYVFIFIFLGTINNQNLKLVNLFEITNININDSNGLDKKEFLYDLENLRNSNIFNLQKDEITNSIFKNELVENFEIYKKYPSELIINIKSASFLANINVNGKYYYIGSNKKLIKSDFIDMKLPLIFGSPSIDDFFKLREKIIVSNLNFEDIKNLYFFPSKRWDIEFLNGKILRLPKDNITKILNNYDKLSKQNNFLKKNIFDMRIKDQLIINEF